MLPSLAAPSPAAGTVPPAVCEPGHYETEISMGPILPKWHISLYQSRYMGWEKDYLKTKLAIGRRTGNVQRNEIPILPQEEENPWICQRRSEADFGELAID